MESEAFRMFSRGIAVNVGKVFKPTGWKGCQDIDLRSPFGSSEVGFIDKMVLNFTIGETIHCQKFVRFYLFSL